MKFLPRVDPVPPCSFAHDLFKGKVIVVIGGGDGIGRSTAVRAAQLQAQVVVIDIRENMLEETLQLIDAVGEHDALGIAGDIAKPATMERIVKNTIKSFGRIDGWANVAYLSLPAPIAELKIHDFQKMVAVNLQSAWQSAKLAAPVMAKKGGGAFVNISSVLSHRTLPTISLYAMVKGGIEAMTRQLAVEFGPSLVRFNSIQPGAIEKSRKAVLSKETLGREPTEEEYLKAAEFEERALITRFQPLRRLGRPEDVADTTIFLLSDLSRFITGQTIAVDGGRMIDGRTPDSHDNVQMILDQHDFLDRINFPYYSMRSPYKVQRPLLARNVGKRKSPAKRKR